MTTTTAPPMHADHDRCYAAVLARDRRFDGCFITAVRTTGIYCRPSCPTPILPKSGNVEFLASTAAAQRRGYRACKRCAPDAVPGSPAWDQRGDLAARAVRLIDDGLIDRVGVAGLADRLAVSSRHLNRILLAELGAGPLDLARARRAQAARVLIETTERPFSELCHASGFGSLRQFNETIQTVFAATPTELRAAATRRAHRTATTPPSDAQTCTTQVSTSLDTTTPPSDAQTCTTQVSTSLDERTSGMTIALRLAVRAPFDAPRMRWWLGAHAVAGVEAIDGITWRRSLRLPNGSAIVSGSVSGAISGSQAPQPRNGLSAPASFGYGKATTFASPGKPAARAATVAEVSKRLPP